MPAEFSLRTARLAMRIAEAALVGEPIPDDLLREYRASVRRDEVEGAQAFDVGAGSTRWINEED